jgi:hypothetical protein
MDGMISATLRIILVRTFGIALADYGLGDHYGPDHRMATYNLLISLYTILSFLLFSSVCLGLYREMHKSEMPMQPKNNLENLGKLR